MPAFNAFLLVFWLVLFFFIRVKLSHDMALHERWRKFDPITQAGISCQGTTGAGVPHRGGRAGPGSLDLFTHPPPWLGWWHRPRLPGPAWGWGDRLRAGWDVSPWVDMRFKPSEEERGQTQARDG